jgi:hypothetical protein
VECLKERFCFALSHYLAHTRQGIAVVGDIDSVKQEGNMFRGDVVNTTLCCLAVDNSPTIGGLGEPNTRFLTVL